MTFTIHSEQPDLFSSLNDLFCDSFPENICLFAIKMHNIQGDVTEHLVKTNHCVAGDLSTKFGGQADSAIRNPIYAENGQVSHGMDHLPHGDGDRDMPNKPVSYQSQPTQAMRPSSISRQPSTPRGSAMSLDIAGSASGRSNGSAPPSPPFSLWQCSYCQN